MFCAQPTETHEPLFRVSLDDHTAIDSWPMVLFVCALVVRMHGVTHVGIGAAFVSWATNLCATVLVGLRAWYAMPTKSLVTFQAHMYQVIQTANIQTFSL